MLDDLKVTRYEDDIQVVLDVAFASNGEDGQGVLPGGLTGQILKKLSNADYDTLWDNPSAGVPNDGTAGQILSKVSSDPYDTIWIDPSVDIDLTDYARLAVANTFTALNTFNAGIVTPNIGMPSETASITMGAPAAAYGQLTINYDDGWVGLTNPISGGSLSVYPAGITYNSTNGTSLVLFVYEDAFAITADAWGSAVEPTLWIQGWNFGPYNALCHITTWDDNLYDIGIATPTLNVGRPRNIYAATSVNTPTIVMPTDSAEIFMGATVGEQLFLFYDYGYLSCYHPWGSGIYFYNTSATGGIGANSEYCGFFSAGEDGFGLLTGRYGAGTLRQLAIQNWWFGPPNATECHIIPVFDNVYDIGIATPIEEHGRPRNIYVASGVHIDTAGTLTTSKPAFTVAQKWNNVAEIFKVVDIDIDTTGENWNFGSSVINVDIDGASVFSVDPYGVVNTYSLGAEDYMLHRTNTAQAAGFYAYNGEDYYTSLPRWGLRAVDVESTGNAGSNFAIRMYNDAGVTLSDPLTITRATGIVNLLVEPTIGGATLVSLYAKLAAAGNIFTGGPITLNRSGAASSADIFFNVATLQTSYVNFQQAGVMRWRIGKGSSAEGGSGATSTGSNFVLQAYDNAGTSLGDVFSVARGSKVVDFAVTPTVAGVPISGGGGGQPLDATLTALAALNATAGFVEQTGADTFTKRATNTFAYLATANTFTAAQTIASGTIATSQPALNVTQTWNDGAVTFTGIFANIIDTASATASKLIDLQVGGVSRFRIDKGAGATFQYGATTNDVVAIGGGAAAGTMYYSSNALGIKWQLVGGGGVNTAAVRIASDMFIGFNSTSNLGGGALDTFLLRDAANTLAQRNAANAQMFNIYNTYTSASVYERVVIGFSGGNARIYTEMLGGTARNLHIYAGASASLNLGSGGAAQWQISVTGHLIAPTDNTYDIGASGAQRPRNVYVAGNISEGGVLLSAKYAPIGGGGGASLSTPNTWTALQSFTTTSGLGLEVISTDLGATVGPIISLKRNSTTPAVDDVIAGLWFQGNDSTPTMQVYSSITSKIIDITPASFDAKLQLQTAVASAVINVLTLGPGAAVGTAVDQGVNTLNAGTLYENAVSLAAKYAPISVVTGYAQLAAANVFTAAQSVTMATPITTSQPGLNVTQTWNSGAVTFEAIKVAITATASHTLSKIFNATVGGTSIFSVRKNGSIDCDGTITTNGGSIATNRVGDSIATYFLANASAGYRASIYFNSIFSRWEVGKNADAELDDQSNVGGNFVITAYSDDNSLTWDALTINRATRVTNFLVTPTIAGVSLNTIYQAAGSYQPAGSYAAAVHTHAIADVTSLQATLDGKAGLAAANTFTTYQTIQTTGVDTLMLTSTDAGATSGPLLTLYRNSPTPAVNDYIGRVEFFGNNSGPTPPGTPHASINVKLLNITSATASAAIEFNTQAGSPASIFRLGINAGVYVGTAIDQGANTFNAGTLYEAGVTLASKYETLGVVAGINTQTASYTLVLADAGKVVEVNNASANTLTIPPNSTVAFPLNTRVDVAQYGAGQTTITAGAGVTIRQREAKLKLTGQYAGASLYKRGTDEWVLFGDVSA